jgi:uncharacterized protein YoxC
MEELVAKGRRALRWSVIAIGALLVAGIALGAILFTVSRDRDEQTRTVAGLRNELASVRAEAAKEGAEHKETVAALRNELAGAKADIATEASRAAELKTDLNTANGAVQALSEKSAALTSAVQAREAALNAERFKAASAEAALDREKARLPPVPIRVGMRRAMLGNGLIGVFTNLSGKQLPVIVALRNPTTGAGKRLSIQVSPGGRSEIGSGEGWSFASGDQIGLVSAGFEPLRVTVP